MTAPDDRAIARAANLIAPILRDNDVRWPTGQSSNRAVPSAADIALRLRAMINDLDPGIRLESGNLAVDWPDDATRGPAKSIGVYVLIASVPSPGAALRDAQKP